jgi:hypothetical protein
MEKDGGWKWANTTPSAAAPMALMRAMFAPRWQNSWKESGRFPSHPIKSPSNGLVLAQHITGNNSCQMSQGRQSQTKTEINKLTPSITSPKNTETQLHPITRPPAHHEATPPRELWPRCPRPGPFVAPAPARRAPRPATPRPPRPRSRRPSRQSAPAGPEPCRQ